ncbi:hypothetical protein FXO37_28793 [Capsicum annuum]|nr:hypothetical protein FXO37_28793 [Capsicum annuum]
MVQSKLIALKNMESTVEIRHGTHLDKPMVFFSAQDYFMSLAQDCKITLIGKFYRGKPPMEEISKMFIRVAVALDQATFSKTRGNVAKVKVEIDLLKSRLDQLWVGFNKVDGFEDGTWLNVEYEKVPGYCIYSDTSEATCQTDYTSNTKEKGGQQNPQAMISQEDHRIDPGIIHDNYLKLISGTNIEEGHTTTEDYATNDTQISGSSNEENDSGDGDYIHEGSEASGEYESVDSEANSDDKETLNKQTLVDITIKSDINVSLFPNSKETERGRKRGRGARRGGTTSARSRGGKFINQRPEKTSQN